MHKKMMTRFFIGTIISCGVFIGCGGGGTSEFLEETYDGRLVDDIIVGASFECGGVSGKTDGDGIFAGCPVDDEVTFKLGKLIIASATQDTALKRSNQAIHLLDILDEENAKKVATLLQSLDTTGGDDKIVLPDNVEEIIDDELGNPPEPVNIKDYQLGEVEVLASNSSEMVGTNFIDPEDALIRLKNSFNKIDELPPIDNDNQRTTGGES